MTVISEDESAGSGSAPNPSATTPIHTRVPRRSPLWSVILLIFVYTSIAVTFSLRNRAWNSSDELDHTRYIEYIVKHSAIPRISIENGIESHQPPLYYILMSVWQKLLGIPYFTPSVKFASSGNLLHTIFSSHPSVIYSRQDALWLHELRLPSIALGLVTVLCAYGAARTIRLPELCAIAIGLFVALQAKELTVATSVTNDALVVPLCALALLFFLLAERARAESQFAKRRVYASSMGLVLGAAAITKFSSLAVAVILVVLITVPTFAPIRTRRWFTRSADSNAIRGRYTGAPFLIDSLLAVAAFLAASGWWFVRNRSLYGQFLATRASQNYLRFFGLHSQPWSVGRLFQSFPNLLAESMWSGVRYEVPPQWLSITLSMLAAISVLVGAIALLFSPQAVSRSLTRLQSFGVVGCIVGGLVTFLLIWQNFNQGDARVALVSIIALSMTAVLGMVRLITRVSSKLWWLGLAVWPIALAGADLYFFFSYLLPYGGI